MSNATQKTAGVLVRLAETANGGVRLIFDDVVASGEEPFRHLAVLAPFTELEVDASAFRNTDLPEAQLGDIGLAIAARLAARANVA